MLGSNGFPSVSHSKAEAWKTLARCCFAAECLKQRTLYSRKETSRSWSRAIQMRMLGFPREAGRALPLDPMTTRFNLCKILLSGDVETCSVSSHPPPTLPRQSINSFSGCGCGAAMAIYISK